MSLYVKLFTNFWTNRKTLRLRAMIGDDALWVPPRLWSYAAEHQANGDFSKYEPGELAMLLGYPKDPSHLLSSLQASGFMDGMKIHGWGEHNEFHKVFAERAKTAAEARWQKERSKEKDKRGDEKRQASPQDPDYRVGGKKEDATSMQQACSKHDSVDDVVTGWNTLPREFCKVKILSSGRRTTINARLNEAGWVANWREALTKIPAIPFMCGKNKRSWRVDFDFFIRPDSVAKIVEGKYSNGNKEDKCW